MKKNNTTTDTNINTNNTMRMSKYHIVLRDKHNELVSWKGYAHFKDAFNSFVGLHSMFNLATDGEIRDCKDGLGFVDSHGNKVCVEKTTAELLMEIIFCYRASAEDMFNTYLKAE